MRKDNYDPFYGRTENKENNSSKNSPQNTGGSFYANNNFTNNNIPNNIKPYKSGGSWFVKRFLPVFVCLLLFVGGILTGIFFSNIVTVGDDLKMLNWMLNLIEKQYLYDLTDAEKEQLLNWMGKGGASRLDGYGDFFTNDEYEDTEYFGIGVGLSTMKDKSGKTFAFINNVYASYNADEGHPQAFGKGIQKYDRFYSITTYYSDLNCTKYVSKTASNANYSKTVVYDNSGITYDTEIENPVLSDKRIVVINPFENVSDISSEMSKIPSDKAIEFDIVIKRNVDPDDGTIFNRKYITNIKRALYDPSFVTYDKIDSQTAVVGILSFTNKANLEFHTAMKKFQDEKMKNLILDLRYNGGGNMAVLGDIAQYLITDSKNSKNVPITYAVFKNDGRETYKTAENNYKNMFYQYDGATKQYTNKIGKIAVLFNEYSASASEALIGAMLDYKTCDYTVGVKSFGKGIMQTTFVYPNRTNPQFYLTLTVARIYWPVSGKCIQTERDANGNIIKEGGITPDEVIENGLFYAGATKFANDLQVQAALSFIG